MRFFSATIFAVIALVVLTTAEAWPKEKSDTPAKTSPEATQPSATQIPTNYITQAAAKAGVVTCLPRINQITNFIAADSQSGALLMPAPHDVDKKPFSIAMEVRNPASSVISFVSSNYSPGADGSCSGTYETVNLWSDPCETVAEKVFPKYKMSAGALSQQIKVLTDGELSHVFMVPIAKGCLVIKKQVLY